MTTTIVDHRAITEQLALLSAEHTAREEHAYPLWKAWREAEDRTQEIRSEQYRVVYELESSGVLKALLDDLDLRVDNFLSYLDTLPDDHAFGAFNLARFCPLSTWLRTQVPAPIIACVMPTYLFVAVELYKDRLPFDTEVERELGEKGVEGWMIPFQDGIAKHYGVEERGARFTVSQVRAFVRTIIA